MGIHIIFGVNNIFFLYKLAYFYQKSMLINVYLDGLVCLGVSWCVLGCPGVSWVLRLTGF